MSNPITGETVLRKVWDENAQALKTIPAASTSFSIELDAADGDNITTKPDLILVSDTTETICTGIKSITLYVEALAGTNTVKVQISPVDSGNVWMDVTSGSVSSDPTLLTASNLLTICARRIRLVVTAGAPVYHLVGQAV